MLPAGRSFDVKRWIFTGASALLLLVILIGVTSRLWEFGVTSPFTDPLDFRAFYCGGVAIERRKNPYRLEPSRSCQLDALAAAGLPVKERFVLPAPLPPYALAAIAVLALLPYRSATAFWLSANILALLVSIAYIAELSKIRPWIVGLSLFISTGVVSLSLGQPIPIVLAASAFAALCARSGNGIGAAVGAAIAALEPHLALPVWIGLALFVPAARMPLVVAGALLGALSLLPGLPLNIEYARFVIPDHARAETVDFEGQYGLSSLLVAFHTPPKYALLAGSVCYAAVLALGLALGAGLRRRTGDPAFSVLAPLASVVLGGAYIHIAQTVVAIPLGLTLVARLPRRTLAYRGVVLAVCLLSIPWPLIDIVIPPGRGTSAVAPSGRTEPHASDVVLRATMPDESMEFHHAAFVAAFARRENKHSFGELIGRKLPTWLALIVILTCATRLSYEDRRSERPHDLEAV
jgi:hypothetical protein